MKLCIQNVLKFCRDRAEATVGYYPQNISRKLKV